MVRPDELRAITRRVGDDLRESNRQQERDSLAAMTKRGLKVIELSDTDRKAWAEAARKAYPRDREELVPPEIFDEVERLRDQYRSTQDP